MSNAIEIAEKFAQALDAEDFEIARGLLSGECEYLKKRRHPTFAGEGR